MRVKDNTQQVRVRQREVILTSPEFVLSRLVGLKLVDTDMLTGKVDKVEQVRIRSCFKEDPPAALTYTLDHTDLLYSGSFGGGNGIFRAGLHNQGPTTVLGVVNNSLFYDPVENRIYFWNDTSESFQRVKPDGTNHETVTKPPLPSGLNAKVRDQVLHPNGEEYFYIGLSNTRYQVYRGNLPYDGSADLIADFAHNGGSLAQIAIDIAREVLYCTNQNVFANHSYIYKVAWDGSSAVVLLQTPNDDPSGATGIVYDPGRDLIYYNMKRSATAEVELRQIDPDGTGDALIKSIAGNNPAHLGFNQGGDFLYWSSQGSVFEERTVEGDVLSTLDPDDHFLHIKLVTIP